MRSSFTIRMGPKSNDKCPIKKKKMKNIGHGQKVRTQYKKMVTEIRGCGHKSGKPRNANLHLKPNEAKKNSTLELPGVQPF